MTNVEFATQRLINSVWTVAFRRVDGGVEVLAYSREIKLGYDRERVLPEGRFAEDDQRTVHELVVTTGGSRYRPGSKPAKEERLRVVNPAFVFSYGDGGY